MYSDIILFMKIFQKFDKDKVGLISLDEFFKELDMKRNVYTDSLCEVFDIDLTGTYEILLLFQTVTLTLSLLQMELVN